MVCVLANALLDAALIPGLGHGGIALSSSIVGAIRALLLWLYLRRRIGPIPARPVIGSLVASAATAALAFWAASLVIRLAGSESMALPWRLALHAVVGGAAYLLLQAAFNRPVVRLVPWILGRRDRPAGGLDLRDSDNDGR